jgi:hypothetical protein
MDDLAYLFCNKPKICNHIFFDCDVASAMWVEDRNILGLAVWLLLIMSVFW